MAEYIYAHILSRERQLPMLKDCQSEGRWISSKTEYPAPHTRDFVDKKQIIQLQG